MSIESSKNPERFSSFELNTWETVSRQYEEYFAKLTSQSVTAILDAGKVTRDMDVLDVCCGPGMITAEAIVRGARAIGIDFSAEAVRIAESNVTSGAEIYRGDAQSLPFDDETFDAVVCGFGIIHVPDPKKALLEMHRVLKSRGALAVSVWEAPRSTNGLGLLFDALKMHADMELGLPHGPDFFQFSEPEKIKNALREVGFKNPSSNIVEQTWEFNEPEEFVAAYVEGSVRSRALLAGQKDAVLDTITSVVVAGMEKYCSGNTYHVPMPALIGSAVK